MNEAVRMDARLMSMSGRGGVIRRPEEARGPG